MRLRPTVLAVSCFAPFLWSACVSETRGPTGEVVATKDDNEGRSPVEQVEDRVRLQLDALPRLAGTDLLAALDKIASYKELALNPIRERLDTPDARTRSYLVYVLGRIGGPEAHRLLGTRLGDADPVVRFESAAALLDVKDLSGVPVLLKGLREPDRKVRFKSFEALRRFTKQDFGYDFAADEPRREQAAAQWDSWWSKTRSELLYRGGSGDSK